jgi:uncharacterized protein (DUF362 family)
MILEADSFIFQPPVEVAFARRILIKPSAAVAQPHPVTTSTETLAAVISGIRKASSADIVILESSARAKKVHTIFKELGYDFPNTVLLDVDQCVPVAIENPLTKPFAVPTFWVPNIILSCDFLITIAPYKIVADQGNFSIRNLLSLLPESKYQKEVKGFRGIEQQPGIDNIIADLYFTLPFDLGIIDARKRLISSKDHFQGKIEDYGKIFIGTPLEVDCEASNDAGITTAYLRLIEEVKAKQGGG